MSGGSFFVLCVALFSQHVYRWLLIVTIMCQMLCWSCVFVVHFMESLQQNLDIYHVAIVFLCQHTVTDLYCILTRKMSCVLLVLHFILSS